MPDQMGVPVKLLTSESQSARAVPLRQSPPALRWYFFLVVAVAVAGLVLVVVLVGWQHVGRTFSQPALWILLALILVTDSYPLTPWLRDVRGQMRIHWSAALLSAALIGFGPATLLAYPFVTVIAVVSLGGAKWRMVFNIAVVVIEGLVAAAVLQLIWGSFDPAVGPSATVLLISGLTVAAIWEVVNVALITTAQRLAGVQGWWHIAKEGARRTAMWLAALTTAPLIAELSQTAPVMLPVVVVVIVATHHTVALNTRSNEQARTDPLTGLPNRGAVMALLDSRLGRRSGRRPDKAVADVTVMLIDLDGFKAVNDTHGHQAGDELLVEVGARIRAVVGNDSLVGRLGGDEFLVVGGHIPDPDALARVIDTEVGRSMQLEDAVTSVSCSIGWAVGKPGMDPVDLFRLVDRDLYRIKRTRPGQRDSGPR
ncbi:GGDEF domain-containing protein [Nakamurella lactea]|uniref:GGDEF domain-containing protein n=1 Tax=Nakamurella lactea TaxID=459515 RepID=UPI00042179FB|nr:GGDEF domain-containing protein [Nakamurella lactea]